MKKHYLQGMTTGMCKGYNPSCTVVLQFQSLLCFSHSGVDLLVCFWLLFYCMTQFDESIVLGIVLSIGIYGSVIMLISSSFKKTSTTLPIRAQRGNCNLNNTGCQKILFILGAMGAVNKLQSI